MPQDMQMIAVTLEKKGAVLRPKEDATGKPIFRAMPLAGFDSLFGGIGETFHPNEIFACLFSAMVARDHFHGGGLSTTCDLVGKDFSKLRPWCREHFAVKAPVGAR